MNNQIGPSEQTIPAQTYQSCTGCKFHSRRLAKSGPDPIYTRNCKHPGIPADKKVLLDVLYGNLGDKKETPDWCPILKQAK